MAINFEFLNNNIDPNNEVKFPYYFDGVSDNDATLRILFIGNSITYHEKNLDIGWNKDCGMAASDIDHDYVHILLNLLKQKNKKIRICVFNGAQWEADYTNQNKLQSIIDTAHLFKPDLTIIRIGENSSKENINNKIDMTPYFIKLIKGTKGNKQTIITSMLWSHPFIDSAIKKASNEMNVTYVPIFDFGENPKYKAIGLYEHKGIAGHPGDLGMAAIANRIYKYIKL